MSDNAACRTDPATHGLANIFSQPSSFLETSSGTPCLYFKAPILTSFKPKDTNILKPQVQISLKRSYAYIDRANIFKALARWADAFYKSKCSSVCLSVCLSDCLSVCVFTFEVPFKRLFAPTSQSRMSNIFRDSESLGKSNGKKWSHIETFLVWKWSKIATQKELFFGCFCFAKHGRNNTS